MAAIATRGKLSRSFTGRHAGVVLMVRDVLADQYVLAWVTHTMAMLVDPNKIANALEVATAMEAWRAATRGAERLPSK